MTPRISFLLMNGNRIVALGVDSRVVQELEQRIAMLRLPSLDHVQVVNVIVARSFIRQRDVLGGRETLAVERCPLSPQLTPFRDVLEFRAEDARMQIVEPAVVTDAVAGAFVRAVVAEFARDAVDLRIVGNNSATVAERSQVLLNDEAYGGGVAEFSDLEAIAASADGLRVILDDLEIVLVGDLANGLHVGALAIEVDWHQQFGAGRDRGLDLARIDTVRAGIGIDKHDGRSGEPDGFRGREEGVGGGDALVAGTDSERLER